MINLVISTSFIVDMVIENIAENWKSCVQIMACRLFGTVKLSLETTLA